MGLEWGEVGGSRIRSLQLGEFLGVCGLVELFRVEGQIWLFDMECFLQMIRNGGGMICVTIDNALYVLLIYYREVVPFWCLPCL